MHLQAIIIYLNEYEQKCLIVLVLDPLSPCPVALWYLVARQIKRVTHSSSTSIKMAVYKPQINGQLVVVVVARAPLIINPITFHSAPVMKAKAIRGWLGCLGNREVNAAALQRTQSSQMPYRTQDFYLLGVHQSLECLGPFYPSLSLHLLKTTSGKYAF